MKKHETSNHFEKKPRTAVAQSLKCSWEGRDRVVLSYPWAERGEFPAPAWKACRKQNLLLTLLHLPPMGPLHPALGAIVQKMSFSPPVHHEHGQE